MTRHLLACLLLASTLAPLAEAQLVETFTGGSNEGGWTYGTPDSIPSSGGNPGWYLRNTTIDTYAPQPRTTEADNAFVGNWRARGVTGFGADFLTIAVNFPALRECTLMLTGTNGCSVYLLGTEFIPQPGAGWSSFDFAIDVDSPTLPAGWFLLQDGAGCSSGDAAWNAIIENVAQVSFFYGDPTFFYIFDQWQVGMDNVRISEGFGTSYCTSNPNSTGGAATISVSGSPSIAANDLLLSASNVPAGQFGLFFYGPAQTQTPFGNGFRCVGGGSTGLGRLDIETAGAGNLLQHALDNTSPPGPAVQLTAGSTWNFQAWFRDPSGGGAFFDLSDAISVNFLP